MMSKTIYLLTFLVFGINAECEPECACEDLERYIVADLDAFTYYEEKTGCSRVTICTGKILEVEWSQNKTNIPTEPDVKGYASLQDDAIPYRDLPTITRDYFTEFGIVCEDGKWMVTKFPLGFAGVSYVPPEEANGKGYKAEIDGIACSS